LPIRFSTCDRVIHAHQQTMVVNNETIKIRPKTFSLLLIFLENPYKVLSKEFLLNTIWDDVEVGEQVLFQTIRELRNLFDENEVIKTHPRKGYAWIAAVEVQKELAQKDKKNQIKATKEDQTDDSSSIKTKPFPWQQLVILLIFSLVFYLFTTSETNVNRDSITAREPLSPLQITGTVVILPMKSDIDDNDHQWVYLGAMDQLISRLKSATGPVVLNPEFVLVIMKEADMKQSYNEKQKYNEDKVRRIFDVSGAGIIVETTLSGSKKNYQLKYKLHFKHDIKRGVIFESDINQALITLADKIALYTGEKTNKLDHAFTSEFGNELLVRALDLIEQKDHLGANNLLKSLLAIEPENIIAHKVLADTYMFLRQRVAAKAQLLIARELAQNARSKELPQIQYLLGLIAFIDKDFDSALNLLADADKYAIEKNDWLYRAFIAQLVAGINVRNNEIEQAYLVLDQALEYHQVIQCPVGTSNTLLQISDIALQQGDKTKAQDYLNRATKIINERNLSFLKHKLNKANKG